MRKAQKKQSKKYFVRGIDENESESGVHLQYELEHGRSGKSEADDATPGNENAEIEEMGSGAIRR